jgi:RNA polymerase sigma factor (sigma-70 family)
MNTYEEIKDDLYMVAKNVAREGEDIDELVNEMIVSNILAVPKEFVKRAAKLRILDFRRKRDKFRNKTGRVASFSESSPADIIDALSAKDDPSSQAQSKEFWEIVEKTLDSTKEMVMKCRYIDGETMESIGERLGLTEGRISQLHKEAIEALRPRLEGYNEDV